MDTIETTISSPVGELRLQARGGALYGVYLPVQHAPPAVAGSARILDETARQLGEYFAHQRTTFDLELAPTGTAFQRRVWLMLREIPFGGTWSYGDLAAKIGKPSASRAVGAANGKNPISIIVPCHRVIAASGELTGYAGGIAAKRWLLAHEAVARVGATVPSCLPGTYSD